MVILRSSEMSVMVKRILFLAVTMGTIFFLVPKDVLPLIGNFAIGWALADISIMLFNKD